MNRTPIYFDHNATTPIAADVVSRLPQALEAWGNPSSIHFASRAPKAILRETRQKIANLLGTQSLELIFTGGGSESNNTVIRGVFENSKNSKRNEFITSTVEHPSVLKTFQWLETQGAKVHYLNVNLDGQIDLTNYKKVLSDKTALVSVMFANNETGVLFPIEEMTKLAHQNGALFHTDAVQALGKAVINLKDLGVDFASFSAHKFYALKGTGVLYVKTGYELPPLVYGGAQERRRRGGTENVIGIFALGVMAEKKDLIPGKVDEIEKLRDYFESEVVKQITEVAVTHQKAKRLTNTSSLIIRGVDGETLLMSLDLVGFGVSTGAACSSGNPEPSPVLLAIGLTRAQAQNSLRVSLGWGTTREQVDQFVAALVEVVNRLRAIENESVEVARAR